MRQIKYILVNDSMPTTPRGKSSNICVDNLGHHFVINSAGAVLKLIDLCQPGSFMPKPRCGEEDLNRCSIGIKYNGSLTDPRLRPLLIDLLQDLREHFPDAKILAKNEYDRWHVNVREDMNDLRLELSDYQ